MQKWWNWVLAVALICLVFFALPLLFTMDELSEEELKPMFTEYLEKFNKSYENPDEYAARFQHFVASVREIQHLNSLSRGPDQHKARYGLTHLSDMSKAEFKNIHLSDERIAKPPHLYGKSWSKFKNIETNKDGYKVDKVDGVDDDPHASHQRDRPCGEAHDNIYVIIRKKRAVLPMQKDWRTEGVVGPVRDQGLCGACWAFSTVGTMESMAAIKNGKLDPLSVQEVIDCAGLGNSGCAGGDICLLLDWLYITNTAVEEEKLYPLKLTDGACKVAKNATGVRVAAFTCDDFVGSEDKIIEALALHGPVTVAVNALTWQNYIGGIIQYHCSGSPTDLNHAVQLVGYDLTAEIPYYIAKNSWGADFGHGGYLNIAMGSNVCGLANEVATVDVV